MRHTEQSREYISVTLVGSRNKPRKFSLPASFAGEVEGYLHAVAAHARKEKSIPAEEVFPELKDDRLRPAAVLRGSRYKEKLTQKKLADLLGINQHHLSEMENAKRVIGKAMAKRLAEVLDCDYRVFL